ncbi:hypothetical protein ACFL2T_00480 [Elusimicrobiota bacterium]
MIELKEDSLEFSFPEVHKAANLSIGFQRTLRIPDDEKTYGLPPGLGSFPLRHVDDFSEKVSPAWMEHGGILLPMYQSEAMWINFSSRYPFAIKIATGKVNAVTGDAWTDGLHVGPQDYVVAPDQPWLDGYVVEKGVIRQFVAMPLGAGYSAEEQITKEAKFGGLQIMAYPLKASAYKPMPESRFGMMEDIGESAEALDSVVECASADMGLAPGGRMTQKIYDDSHKMEDWELEHSSRCFVHLANSLVWRQITGKEPPTVPPTSKEYTDAGLPWFEYYDDKLSAVKGSDKLKGMKSVNTMGKEKGDKPLPENESVTPEKVVVLRKGLKKGQVREWAA